MSAPPATQLQRDKQGQQQGFVDAAIANAAVGNWIVCCYTKFV